MENLTFTLYGKNALFLDPMTLGELSAMRGTTLTSFGSVDPAIDSCWLISIQNLLHFAYTQHYECWIWKSFRFYFNFLFQTTLLKVRDFFKSVNCRNQKKINRNCRNQLIEEDD